MTTLKVLVNLPLFSNSKNTSFQNGLGNYIGERPELLGWEAEMTGGR